MVTMVMPLAFKEAIAWASGLNVTVSDIEGERLCEAAGVAPRLALLESIAE
jgi:hypothetical protein